MTGLSALTLASGRPGHLANVLRGFARQTRSPEEVIIGVMQPDLYDALPACPFPVRQIRVGGDGLPLARARNAVAAAARGDILAFVDVDCVPHPEFVADYAAVAGAGQGLFMGEVLYLPGGFPDPLDVSRSDQAGARHSDRRGPPAGAPERCADYRCFWSLNFALSAQDWRASGGFDERYVGYGGEDTDFARGLDARSIPIWWSRGARVYHQHHPHCMPPVHHIASVMRNADLFASKWGHRTMEHWLYAFQLMGLIENGPDGLKLLREPAESDYALCRQHADMPYANTRRVIDQLQRVTSRAERESAARAAEVRLGQSAFLAPRPAE